MFDGVHTATTSPQFVRDLALRLFESRRAGHRPRWLLARRSRGRFTVQDLREAESGSLPLDAETVSELAALYGIDPAEFVPQTRGGLEILPGGLVRAGGMTRSFTPGDATSLIDAYFSLTRALRASDDQTMALRRDDIDAIARYLHASGKPSSDLDEVLAVSLAERRILVGTEVDGSTSIGFEPTHTADSSDAR